MELGVGTRRRENGLQVLGRRSSSVPSAEDKGPPMLWSEVELRQPFLRDLLRGQGGCVRHSLSACAEPDIRPSPVTIFSDFWTPPELLVLDTRLRDELRRSLLSHLPWLFPTQ